MIGISLVISPSHLGDRLVHKIIEWQPFMARQLLCSLLICLILFRFCSLLIYFILFHGRGSSSADLLLQTLRDYFRSRNLGTVSK